MIGERRVSVCKRKKKSKQKEVDAVKECKIERGGVHRE